MRRIGIMSFLLIFFLQGFGQGEFSLNEFNQQRNKSGRTGMLVLTSWGGANLIYGLIAQSQTSGTEKFFHQMNAMWGGVNAAIGFMGYLGSRKSKELSLSQSVRAQYASEKTFLFNAGLDLAYIGGGLYLHERSKSVTKNPSRLKGYGGSIIMQGAALLIFDVTMYSIHHKHGKKLLKFLDKSSVYFAPGQMGMVVKL